MSERPGILSRIVVVNASGWVTCAGSCALSTSAPVPIAEIPAERCSAPACPINVGRTRAPCGTPIPALAHAPTARVVIWHVVTFL
jgi:hypothetical protein